MGVKRWSLRIAVVLCAQVVVGCAVPTTAPPPSPPETPRVISLGTFWNNFLVAMEAGDLKSVRAMSSKPKTRYQVVFGETEDPARIKAIGKFWRSKGITWASRSKTSAVAYVGKPPWPPAIAQIHFRFVDGQWKYDGFRGGR